MIKKLFKYLEPIWTSKDNKPSIRRALSLFFAILFAIEVFKTNPHVEVLWVISANIAALLSLTTFQNISHSKIDADKQIVENVIEEVKN